MSRHADLICENQRKKRIEEIKEISKSICDEDDSDNYSWESIGFFLIGIMFGILLMITTK